MIALLILLILMCTVSTIGIGYVIYFFINEYKDWKEYTNKHEEL